MLDQQVGAAANISLAKAPAKRMLADTATVGFWSAVSKVVGAAKIFVAARMFGTGDAMDAYLVAILLPSFVADVLAAPMDNVLVPAYVRADKADGREAAEQLYTQVMLLSAGALTVVALLAAALSAWVLPLLGASFTAEKLAYTQFLFFIMLPIIPLSGPWIAARSVLNAQGRFAAAAALPVITPALSIAILLAAGRRWGVDSLAVATTVGIALQMLACVGVVKSAGFAVRISWTGFRGTLNYLLGQYAPVVALSLVAGSSVLIDQAFAGALASGSVSALNYGTKLATVLMSLGPLAVGTVVLAHASALIEHHDARGAIGAIGRYAAAAFAVSLVAVLGLIAISEPALRLVFRGSAFSSNELHNIAHLQNISLMQVPITILLAIGVRLIAAARENRILYGVAVVTVASTFAADAIFTHWYGLAGIPAAGILVRLVSVLYVFCKIRQLQRIDIP